MNLLSARPQRSTSRASVLSLSLLPQMASDKTRIIHMNKEEKQELLQDNVSDEVMLKYISAELRDTKKRLEEAEQRIDASKRYAKGLEEENVLLQEKVELYESWMEGVPDKKNFLTTIAQKIEDMQDYIKRIFPKRVVEVVALKKKLIHQSFYISNLQAILDSKGLDYPKPEEDPTTVKGNYDINDLDVFAVRGKREKFEGNPLDVSVHCTK